MSQESNTKKNDIIDIMEDYFDNVELDPSKNMGLFMDSLSSFVATPDQKAFLKLLKNSTSINDKKREALIDEVLSIDPSEHVNDVFSRFDKLQWIRSGDTIQNTFTKIQLRRFLISWLFLLTW